MQLNHWNRGQILPQERDRRGTLILERSVETLLISWMAASVLLDLVVMPTLYWGGMMEQSGFVSTGYRLFSQFNRIESLIAVAIAVGLLSLQRTHWAINRRYLLGSTLLLVVVSLIYTYGLTPAMAALGMPLNYPDTPGLNQSMLMMQSGYWLLEVLKLGLTGFVLYGLGFFGAFTED